jgi:pimeloyl-ACP methyl ester carboxylesterase
LVYDDGGRKMKQTKTGYAEVNGSKLYYEIAGEGHPLVCVHAAIADRRMWDDQWQAFGQHHQVIRYDRRGHGETKLAGKGFSHRRDLHDLLTQLGIRQAHLVGCSGGGELALDFALAHPKMVSALVLVSATPSGFQMQGEPPKDLMAMMGAMEQGDIEQAIEFASRVWVDGPQRTPEQSNAEVRQRFYPMIKTALSNGVIMLPEADPIKPPAVERLSEVAAPTLIIVGSVDNSELLRAADMMANGIPGAQKVVISNTAHLLNMEKPDEFNRVVLDFLAKAEK